MTGASDLMPALGVAECAIRRVAVIGAGAMGSGIAAQFANAGVPVDLLDVPGDARASRNAPAQAGIDRQLKASGFMAPEMARLVRPGTIADDLGRLADVDWIVEAVVERLDVKRDLYARIDAVRRPGTLVSSNTSTIPRRDLVAQAGPDFARDFLITHFFNPPRVMRLVELVTARENDPATVEKAREACEIVLGKTVVACRDTPGFIANRIGCYWLAVGVLEAQRLGLTPEEADAVMAALGTPRTGVFGLMDLVGIDLVPHVWGSLMSSLPETDALHRHDLPGAGVVRDLIASGRFGRKTKAGFYRMTPDKTLETLDFASGDYRRAVPVSPKDLPGGGRDVATLLADDGKLGEYAQSVLVHVLAYAATNGPDIGDDVAAIDTAMTLGYGWKKGPFRLADALGVGDLVARLESRSIPVPALLRAAGDRGGFFGADGAPLATDGHRTGAGHDAALAILTQSKAAGAPIAGNGAASLWDIGEGVACFEMHTKMNAFAAPVLDVLEETLDRGGRDFEALVLGNDDPRAFSAGADLSLIVGYIKGGDFAGLDSYIARGQQIFHALKYANFPVVAAMHGLALGGGCEFGLHADAIVAHAELNAGLPEVLVGIIPGWGGCTQLLLRAQADAGTRKGPLAPAAKAFETISSGRRSGSAHDAGAMGLLRPGDGIVMNRDRLLDAARKKAAALVGDGYAPPEVAAITVAGASGRLGLMNAVDGLRARGAISEQDRIVADALAGVLTGGASADPLRPVSEWDIMTLEREALIALSRHTATQERITHMLATGKPLRN